MKEFSQIIALKDVHQDQPFRVVAGPSGHLTDDIFVKKVFIWGEDKYLCQTIGPASEDIQVFTKKSRLFSPRFKVYVQGV